MFSLCLTHSLHGVFFNAIDRYDIRRFTHLVGGEVRVPKFSLVLMLWVRTE
jgi:hypothetical protein